MLPLLRRCAPCSRRGPRSHEDRNGKRYAAQIRATLPPFPITREWGEVEAFLETV